MAAYDLWAFQTFIIDAWNDMDRKEVPEFPSHKCHAKAYPTKGIYDRLRPLVHRQRPFLPMVNRLMEKIDLTELPPYDPGEFDWRKAERMASKKRETGAAATKSPAASPVKTSTGKRMKRASRRKTTPRRKRVTPKRVKKPES